MLVGSLVFDAGERRPPVGWRTVEEVFGVWAYCEPHPASGRFQLAFQLLHANADQPASDLLDVGTS